MLEAKIVTSKLKEYEKVLSIYEEAFPKNEKLPKWLLTLMAKRKFVDFLAFYDEGIFCGLTYLIHYKNTCFVLYLAIDRSIRSKGYGTKILNWIVDNNKSNNIVLNIETVDKKYDNYKQRLDRQRFYLKNGFMDTEYKLEEKGDIYDVLYKGKTFVKTEYEELIKKFSYGLAPKKLK